MALPPNNPNAATAAVEAEIKRMGPKDLVGLPDLDGGDLQLIGTLIQYFSFMDLNLRRALEAFHAKKLLGTGLAEHEVHLVVTPRPEFAEMVQSAKTAHEWLAKKVPEWNERYLKK